MSLRLYIEALGIRTPIHSMGAGRLVSVAAGDAAPVEYGQTLGFTRISTITNGRMFYYPEFAARVRELLTKESGLTISPRRVQGSSFMRA